MDCPRSQRRPTGRTAVEGTCAGMRAGVHDEVSRARGCDHVSLSKWHRHRRSRAARKSHTATRKRNRRVGGDASDRGAPYVFTTCGSETVSAEPVALSRAKSRREALGTATGASEVERKNARSTGRKRPVSRGLEPPKRARRRENAVRTGLSIASSTWCRKTSRPSELKRRGRHTIRWVPVSESVDEQKSAARIFRSSARNSRKALAREALERSSQELGARQVI